MDREFPQPDLGCTIVLDSSPMGYTVHWHGPPDDEAARARAERLLQDAQDLTLERYQNRAQAAPRVMARWAAYNDQKLASGEWSPQDFTGFLQQVGPVVILLQSLAFGACAAAVQGFSHPLATDQAKADYLAMMAAEGAEPQP